eukprot:3340831-Prymnesium_polylepis.1
MVVGGDFNGDGKTDLAALGAAGLTSVPLAFSRGDGAPHDLRTRVRGGRSALPRPSLSRRATFATT